MFLEHLRRSDTDRYMRMMENMLHDGDILDALLEDDDISDDIDDSEDEELEKEEDGYIDHDSNCEDEEDDVCYDSPQEDNEEYIEDLVADALEKDIRQEQTSLKFDDEGNFINNFHRWR